MQKEKRRTPAWTDRVLFRGGVRPVKQLTYTSANLLVSDHKPVCSNLRLQVGQLHCSLTDPASDCSVCKAPAGLHLALRWQLTEEYLRQCLTLRCLLTPVPSGGRKQYHSPDSSSCCACELVQSILWRHWLPGKPK